MPFKAILKNLVEKTPGATGAILLDWEGEAVAYFSTSLDLDLPIIGAHKGIILNLTRDALLNLNQTNSIKTIAISTELARIALATVKEGYYLIVTVEKSKPLGKAFFESRIAIKEIEREMG